MFSNVMKDGRWGSCIRRGVAKGIPGGQCVIWLSDQRGTRNRIERELTPFSDFVLEGNRAPAFRWVRYEAPCQLTRVFSA